MKIMHIFSSIRFICYKNEVLACGLVSLISIPGCASFGLGENAKTLGEGASGYTYIPIDSSRVRIDQSKCAIGYSELKKDNSKLFDFLPDNSVRLSMEVADSKGTVVYGVSKIEAAGSSYRLTADYVNSDTVNIGVLIRKSMLFKKMKFGAIGLDSFFEVKSDRRWVSIFGNAIGQSVGINGGHGEREKVLVGTEEYEIKIPSDMDFDSSKKNKEFEPLNIPVYVGIGLRVVAEGVSLSSDAKISGIGVVGSEAEAKRVLGSLTVQTLGINSQAVVSALPVQSELSRTSAENAFVALGSIKAMLHQDKTTTIPRVVGLYLPLPGGKALVNAIVSAISRDPVKWCPNGFDIDDRTAVGVR